MFRLALVYCAVITVVLGVLFFVPELWSPPLKSALEKQLFKRFNLVTQIERLKVSHLFPLTLRLEKTRLKPENGKWGVDIKAVDLALGLETVEGNWLRPRLKGEITAFEPVVQFSLPQEEKTNQSGLEASSSSSPPTWLQIRPQGLDFGLEIQVVNAWLDLQGAAFPMRLVNANLRLTLPSFRPSWWRPTLQFDSQLQTQVAGKEMAVPLQLSVQNAALNPQGLNLDLVEITLANLKLKGKGQHLFNEKRDDFQLTVEPVDLSQLPISFLPAGQWQGTFRGGLTLRRESEASPRIEGQLQSEGVQGDLKWEKEDFSMEGRLALKTSLRFLYQETLSLDDGSFNLDLGGIEIKKKGMFHKSAGIPLLIDVVADSREEIVFLRRALIRLANLRVEAAGQVDSTSHGRLDISVPETSLAGFETLFPFLEKAPLQGTIQAHLKALGPINDWLQLRADIDRFEVKSLRANVNYEKDLDHKISGPILADLNGRALWSNGALRSVEGRGRLDLSATEIIWSERIKKPSQWRLALGLEGGFQGKNIELKPSQVITQAGNINLSAKIRPVKGLSQSWSVLVETAMASLNLATLTRLMPLPQLEIQGLLQGSLRGTGTYVQDEQVEQLPLAVNGFLKWSQGILKLKRQKTPEVKAPTKSNAQSPALEESWLPAWPIVRQSRVKLEAQLKSAEVLEVPLENVAVNGEFKDGRYQGAASVSQLWGGQIHFSKLNLHPTIAPPTMEIKGNWQDLEGEKLLAWISPKMKDYMSGKINGTVEAEGFVPNSLHGFQGLNGRGDVQLQKAELKTFRIEEKLNTALEKLKLKEPNGTGGASVPFYAQATYHLAETHLQLENVLLNTEKRDELRLRGQVKENLELDLTGTVAIGSTRFTGAVAKANSDKTGRLVIPIQIRGDARHPDFSLSGATVKALLTNTIENEVKSLGDQIKKSSPEELKNKVKKLLGR